jgi:uncharacterized membrane protein YesL
VGRAFRAIWLGILDTYGELFPAVGMNLLWFALSIPLSLLGLGIVQIAASAQADPDVQSTAFLIYAVLLALLLVTGPNPISAGIHLWANHLVKEERVEFGLFWQGLREYWRPSLVLFLISAVGLMLLVANALFYLSSEIVPLKIFGIVWLYAIVLWLCMQLYLLPLLVEQDDKRIRLVLRNAFFLMMANVFPSLILFVVLTVLVVLSIALSLLIVLLTTVAVALISARALQLLLERYQSAATKAD